MPQLDQFLNKLWQDYSTMNQQAEAIHRALEKRGEKVINDHVAFRTFNFKKVNIEAISKPFLHLGYKAHEKDYDFPEKKLRARHFEHQDPGMPKVFISELRVEAFSDSLQTIVKNLTAQVPEKLPEKEDFLVSGVLWKKIPWKIYQELLNESEYAAWMAAFGFRVNHFTVFFNALKTFKDFSELNEFIKGLGFKLNDSGGEIKGSKDLLLEQSSTLAYPVKVDFEDRSETIPACYYEFARRYPTKEGKLFQGFLPDSANKIFESTDYRKK